MIQISRLEIRWRRRVGSNQADPVVPISAQPDRVGADQVVARSGDEGRLFGVDAQGLQRKPIRPWVGLVVAGVFRRDFQNGISLCNTTTSSLTVALGGTFHKIKGTQAPTINDGGTVTSVTLRAKDGIILLH